MRSGRSPSGRSFATATSCVRSSTSESRFRPQVLDEALDRSKPAMKVGLFVDARNPPAWERPWASHYEELLRQIVDAEALGIDSGWLTEHHFFEDGYLAAA